MKRKTLLLVVVVCFVLTGLGTKTALACENCTCGTICDVGKTAPAPKVKTGCKMCNAFKSHRKSGYCPKCQKRYRRGRKAR